ncbi:unnamed protein product [Dicrocoelium dendriticum]|nr:unnamed protein product [Dicrocoelium dendriticum]
MPAEFRYTEELTQPLLDLTSIDTDVLLTQAPEEDIPSSSSSSTDSWPSWPPSEGRAAVMSRTVPLQKAMSEEGTEQRRSIMITGARQSVRHSFSIAGLPTETSDMRNSLDSHANKHINNNKRFQKYLTF